MQVEFCKIYKNIFFIEHLRVTASGLRVSKCNSKRFLTCPKMMIDKSFTYNITKQKFDIINQLTVCSCHVTYAFESESTLYSCLNVKELLARSRREI